MAPVIGKIGALGFIGNEVAIIVSFYDDRGMGVVEVAMAARFDMTVIERDPDFYMTAMNLWLRFAKGLVIDGMYASWIGVSVSLGTGAIAKELADGLVKQFIIKKGMEVSVKAAVMKAVGREKVMKSPALVR